MRRPILALCTASWLVSASLVASASPPSGGDVGADAARTASGARAMQGTWIILGPASMAHLPLMIELTLQASEPTAAEYAAAHLTAEQQQQVAQARVRVAADPQAPDVVEMRATLAGLQAARVQIEADRIIAGDATSQDVMPYRVLREDGLQVDIETTAADGSTDTLTITLPGRGLLMMGPKGEEPLVLRRVPGQP